MYEQTNTMMETKTSFQIPQLLDGDNFTSEDLADDMEGLRLSFTRIKIPGGGHLQFEIPSGNPDVPDYAPYLEGVILYSHNSNAYWPEGSEYDDDQPPLCQSFDGKVGYGEPGGTCADCVLNQFGSDGNNKGKACKNMRMLYLLRSGEYMPIQIALPPTSLMPYIGMEDDFKLCKLAFLYAYDCIASRCRQIRTQKEYSAKALREMCNSYGWGFCRGLSAAFQKQEAEHQEWGLVMVVPQAVEDAVSKMKRSSYKISSTSSMNRQYAAMGYADGQEFDMRRRLEPSA